MGHLKQVLQYHRIPYLDYVLIRVKNSKRREFSFFFTGTDMIF